MLRIWFLLPIIFALFAGNAIAQEILVQGGFPPVQDGVAKHHMSPLGRACLTIVGYAKPELVNKNIYQHWIRAANDCGQNIKVRVCYYETQDCIEMSVPPWEKKDSILGIFPALKRFRFEVKEQF
jgi:hypothetical protein